MLISKCFFKPDVTVRPLAIKAKLEQFLMPAVITQEIHEDFEVNRRFKEFRKLFPDPDAHGLEGIFGGVAALLKLGMLGALAQPGYDRQP